MLFRTLLFSSLSVHFESHLVLKAIFLVQLNQKQSLEEKKDKLKKLIQKSELSISAYDTAWVAMVPSQHSPQTPSFPQCVDWVLQNQCWDGSWRLPHQSSDLLKDVLQSTLACVLALKKWGIGDEQIKKGVQFIEHNISSVIDENIISPIGFDVIFPGMLHYASDLSLNIDIQEKLLIDLLHKRDVDLRRNHDILLEGRKAYMAYVSEGAVDTQDWEIIMKYQKKNGSLFSSPSTTAAALTKLQNSDCRKYLSSTLKKFGNAVPTIYPLDRYVQLFVVDNLEKLGIARHFTEEINYVMDETYRSWLQGDEEIVDDASTCALAFRLLRKNGYDVSSDPLVKFLEEDFVPSNLNDGKLMDINTIIELYRASEMVLHPDEGILEMFNIRTKLFLKQWLSKECHDVNGLSVHIRKQVQDVLKFPFHADLQWVRSRRNIENSGLNNTRLLKTSYCLLRMGDKDFVNLAVEDFTLGLHVHHEEFADLERWVVDNKLDKLTFARQKSVYGYFSASATLTSPELSDARMSWAKNCVLTTVIDDFFDVGASIEEMKNLIELVERWDESNRSDCCSEKVEIIFSALKKTICELGHKTIAWQSRDETNHIIQIWLDTLRSFLREAEWTQSTSVPTLDEYMANGYVSFALGPIILPALYFIGPKLPKDVFKHSDVQNLFKLLSTCGRLLNDSQGFEMESKLGKLNAVPLHMIHGIGGHQTQEAVVEELRHQCNTLRRELLRSVLHGNDSVLPRECRDLFWNMSQIVHLFYAKDDGFSSKEMTKSVKTIIFEPLSGA